MHNTWLAMARLTIPFALISVAVAANAAGPQGTAAPQYADVRAPSDPLLAVAKAELAASNRHDLDAFLHVFSENAVILVDASPYSYRGQTGIADFFRHNLLGSEVQYTIKPGAPQTEDRTGDRAYLEMVVNVRATDAKGDAFNDPIHWIGVLERADGVWRISGLVLTTTGG
ncbi:MAG TPA: DUF4440 domain-containing protein [Rhodanobacteraceae bacterium]|nr:DUF4440 domain-containing protein [Rhodanobacteraceae bacterium]